MTSIIGHSLDLPVADEGLVYQSDRTIVRRVALGGAAGTVIHKEPIGADSDQRRRHETAILRRLAGVPGVAQLGTAVAAPEVIVLEDLGGSPLRDLSPVAGPALVDLALRVATVVAAVHRRGVVHKDISPANVVLTADGRAALIDFELATTFAEERPSFIHQSQIAGTLAYIAPEQTGRTGGSVDQRADLYSLGATLYELATGRPPFGEDDPLQLIHCHLAELPTAPAALNPEVPAQLSEIIMRLLEKEPDRRYQSAEGLVHDLGRLATGNLAPFTLGERDFPLRLSPPSRLVGRDDEIAALRSALAGTGRTLLVSGAPGVGKTALIDELRSLVTARGGWFVSGKFDQNRADLTSDAIAQAMRGVCRLLLAEPEASLTELRSRIVASLGGNAGMVASMLPELAVLLDVTPEDIGGDQARLIQGGLQLLRAVVSPDRPLVMVVDDLQWAPANPIAFLDAVVCDDQLTGLLVVGAYRDAEVDAAHPWSVMLARWDRLDCAPLRLHLHNLPPADLSELLAEMLRLPAAEAARLSEQVVARTGGNPYDSVELVNALRRDGVLTAGESGWSWDDAALRAFVGDGNVLDLLTDRMRQLPAGTQALLAVMACLACEVEVKLLRLAAGLPEAVAAELLGAALEDGLLVLERGAGEDTVRFRHDRVQQAAYGRLGPDRRRELQLASARRLADHPAFGVVAAQQYLAAAGDVTETAERCRVVGLFRTAAAGVRLVNYVAAEQFLAAAVALVDADDPLRTAVETEWHAALCVLGRLAEADEVYRAIARRDPDPLDLLPAVCMQITSLTVRRQTRAALTIGLDLLPQLGVHVPPAGDLPAAVERGLAPLLAFAAVTDPDVDRGRPDIDDPRMVAAATLLNKMMSPAFFGAKAMMGWLVTEARRLWDEHGPLAALVGPIAHAGSIMAAREDYFTGYGAIRRVLAAGEERGYEPETAQARFLFSITAGHWFEPLEDTIQQARQAHEGLVRAGEVLFACSTFNATTPPGLDTAATLDSYAAEVQAGLRFAARTGNEHVRAISLLFRQLVDVLRDDSDDPTAAFDSPGYLATVEGHPIATVYHHINRALAAAILGEPEALDRHSAAAMPMLHLIQASYTRSRAYLLRALALADQVRGGRAEAAVELDACREWLARRAADNPATFGHQVRLIDAERAWAAGAPHEATAAFDTALGEVANRRRPGHQALIAERAATFHLASGSKYIGRHLLTEALRGYQGWGATAKVRQLEAAYPFLRGAADNPGRRISTATARVSAESIDLLAVLKASQALSSETNLDRLRERVGEVLRTLTGASIVRVLLRGDAGWYLSDDAGVGIPLAEAGDRGLLPLTAFRYAERTRTPLLVEDATQDDRFARDPYVRALDCCSLLAVPILSQGDPRAMVLLENRLSRNAFTVDRLDAVLLIAGQLSVSMDNARLYASLERKVAERTEELEVANRRLQQLSITDPLTGLANRRQLDDRLAAEWQRDPHTGGQVAIAMIDVDHFKLYNDHYGHPAGDACLRQVAAAAAAAAAVRGDDLVARYGGEEFAIVLHCDDLEAAHKAAERVRAAVEALEEPHEKSSTGRLTVSIGVACVLPGPDNSPEQLIEAADAQLYQAKRGGRNRVS
ncbi:ATPase [Actinoplanes sp. ATCC 53533]|uniref:diguanylate cyclase n=1 Tax=Actinoplanes sp. ATCC 53533 TaxID=1288362 RepID=UPI000F783367|nr:diguanylate cyclase [Actinoplanes sp. ATCC 53533]RSM63943.1 ATPase [Actinoplanes sp. ATCC 53533]